MRDLAAASAFGSMSISGQVPLWTVALFGLGLLLALLDLRVLAKRGLVTGVGLAATAVILASLVFGGAIDLVVAACAFAGVITVQRLLSEPAPATDGQVHLTSLLMIAGGAALSGELLFAVCLVVFATLASLSLGLGIAESALAAGEELPLRPLLRQLSWALVAATAMSLAFFILFPRLSWNVATRRVSPGLLPVASAGMSDKVTLGGDGSIKSNPRIVMRVELSPDPGTEKLDAYWVGHVYDTFDGSDWKGGGEKRPPRGRVELLPGGPGLVRQRIELLPSYGARTLVGLSPVALFGNATAHSPGGVSARTLLTQLVGEEVRFEQPALAYSYHAYSRPPGEGDGSPEDAARNLQLPQNLDPRVGELAASIVGPDRTPLRAANLIAEFLRTRYRYSLELSGAVSDPLADFLFTRKAGHCEHFATALTVMLRTLGIPARVAAGFYGGDRVGDEYVVRAGDAHAWTQVYVPGRGFLIVDATPEGSRTGSPSALLEWLTRQYEALDTFWRSRVIDYSILDQAELARTLVRPPEQTGTGGVGKLPWRAALWAGALLLAGVLAVRGLRRRSARPPPAEATRLLDQVERALRAARVQAPEEPLEELAARLRATDDPLAPTVGRIARRYLEARFGAVPLAPEEARGLTEVLARRLKARPPANAAGPGPGAPRAEDRSSRS